MQACENGTLWLDVPHDNEAVTRVPAGLLVNAPLGRHAVCYSTDNGATWVRQTGVELHVWLPSPPAATAIAALVAAPTCSGIADDVLHLPPSAPDVIVLDAACGVEAVGVTPSPRSVLRLVATASSDPAFPCARPTGVVALQTVYDLAPALWEAIDVATALTAPAGAGAYRLCYSTDGGATFVAQTAVGNGTGTVSVRPPLPTPTSITSVTPSPVAVSGRPGAAVTLILAGVVPSPSTYITVIRESGACTNRADYLPAHANGVVPLTVNTAVTVTGAFTALVPHALCYSTRGPDPAQFVRQAVQLSLVAAPAKSTDITAIAPTTIVATIAQPVRSTSESK